MTKPMDKNMVLATLETYLKDTNIKTEGLVLSDTAISAVNLDSLDIVEATVKIEEEFGIELPDDCCITDAEFGSGSAFTFGIWAARMVDKAVHHG